MKTKDIEEVFLDQVLIDIQQLDQNKCLSIGSKNTFRFHSNFLLFL